jgi:sugar lactone lactonase YvrE
MGLSTANPQVISGRAWRGFGVAVLALGLLAACGGGGGGGGATVEAPVATSLTASSTTPLRGAPFHLTPVYSNGTGAITYSGGTVVCPATGQDSADLTANWSGARQYTLTVTNSANATATTAATVTPQTVSVGAISPAAPTIVPSGTASFSSTVTGGYAATVTWSVAAGTNTDAGTIDASTGAYTAPASVGTVVVTATSVDDPTQSASTTATIAAAVPDPTGTLTASTITPAWGDTTVTITPNFTNGTATVGTTVGGSEISGNATTGAAIAVQHSGFVAAQTYYLRVTNSVNVYHDDQVTITPTAVSLTALSPATPTIAAGGSTTFSTTASGGYKGTVTWSAAVGSNAGAGSITSGGVYTAPTTAGTVVITATSDDDATKTVSTTATVVAAPAITSFTITQDTFTSGSTGAVAHATFAGGTGLITGGGIASEGLEISSGGSVTITPTPTSTRTYTLTVHSTALGSSDATLTATALVGKLSILGGVPSGMGNINGVVQTGSGTKARFWMPNGMVFDPSGNLYVADYENNCIRMIDGTTGAVTTPYGSTSGQHGSADGDGNDATFFGPAGLAIDTLGTYLYVADAWNQTIRKINLGTTAVGTLAGTVETSGYVNDAGTGTSSAGASQFHFATNGAGSTPSLIPPALALNGTILYVADQVNHVIRAVDTGTGAVTLAFGTPNVAGSSNTSGSLSFNYPTGLAFDGTALYVTDYGNDSVRAITIGTGAGSDLATGLAGPTGLALNGTTLYAADYAGCVIRSMSTAGGGATVLSGVLSTTGSADGDGTAASFHYPTAMAVSGTNLYIADSGNNTLRLMGLSSPYSVSTYAGFAGNPDYSDAGTGLFNNPTGVVYDNGYVYVADTSNGALRAINLSDGTVSTLTIAGDGRAPAGFSPSAIAVDSSHLLYVADDNGTTVSNTIYTYSVSGGTLTAMTTDTTFDKPSAMVVDNSGNLYVADANAAKVFKITAGAATELGTGYAYPQGLALNPAQDLLYVADGSGNVILTHSVTGTDAPVVLAGTVGVSGYADGATTSARFGAVAGMASDSAGNLYVADTTNQVVRQVTPAGNVTTICGIGGSMANIATSGGPFDLPATLARPQAVALVPALGSGSNKMFIALADSILSISFNFDD